MSKANAGCGYSVPDILGMDLMDFFNAKLHELLIPSNYNNNTEIKTICLTLSFCFCRQSYQMNILGLM